MSEKFLYEYEFRSIDNMKTSGRIVGASDDGKAIVSAQNKNVYIYYINDDKFQSISKDIKFQPLTSRTYNEENEVDRSVLVVKGQNTVIVYMIQKDSKKEVAKMIVNLPLKNDEVEVEYYENDEEIIDMHNHPQQNSLIIMDKMGYHNLESNYTIPIGMDIGSEEQISSGKLYLIKDKNSINYYSFSVIKETNQNTTSLNVKKFEEQQYNLNYNLLQNSTQVGNFQNLQRFDYKDGLFGITLNKDSEDESQDGRMSYFVDLNANVTIEQNLIFHSFSHHKENQLLYYDEKEVCYASYKLDSNFNIQKEQNNGLECVQNALRVNDVDSGAHIHPFTFSQGSLQIYSQHYPDSYNPYQEQVLENVSEFSINYPEHVIVSSKDQNIELYRLERYTDPEAIAYLTIFGLLILIHALVIFWCICRPLCCSGCCISQVKREKRKRKEVLLQK